MVAGSLSSCYEDLLWMSMEAVEEAAEAAVVEQMDRSGAWENTDDDDDPAAAAAAAAAAEQGTLCVAVAAVVAEEDRSVVDEEDSSSLLSLLRYYYDDGDVAADIHMNMTTGGSLTYDDDADDSDRKKRDVVVVVVDGDFVQCCSHTDDDDATSTLPLSSECECTAPGLSLDHSAGDTLLLLLFPVTSSDEDLNVDYLEEDDPVAAEGAEESPSFLLKFAHSSLCHRPKK